MVFRVGLQEESLTDEFPMLMQRHVLFGGQGEALQQSFGAPTARGSSGGGAVGQPKQRARRGQATDPHSIAERLRRERIAEGMKSLHELVPNANKTDKASMLDEIINYVKFLQLQVKEKSGEGTNTSSSSSSSNEGMTVTERQVVKLMEEDMGSAMQYLQGKGLCLMPISLASTISTTATSHLATTNPIPNGGSVSPTMSVLTVQSAIHDTPKLE